jgi:hypothetical protein
MKVSIFLFAVILSVTADLPALDGQSAAPESPAPAEGKAAVKLDAKKLMDAFASAGAEEQSRAGKAAQALRAEAYPSALKALEKLLAEGHMTLEQKELVTSFVAQLKQMTAKKQ